MSDIRYTPVDLVTKDDIEKIRNGLTRKEIQYYIEKFEKNIELLKQMKLEVYERAYKDFVIQEEKSKSSISSIDEENEESHNDSKNEGIN